MTAPRSRQQPKRLDAGMFQVEISSFALRLAAEGKAAKTIRAYTEAVQWFAAARLTDHDSRAGWEQVSSCDIQGWMAWLLDRYSPAYASNQYHRPDQRANGGRSSRKADLGDARRSKRRPPDSTPRIIKSLRESAREGTGDRGGPAGDVQPLVDVFQVGAHGCLGQAEPAGLLASGATPAFAKATRARRSHTHGPNTRCWLTQCPGSPAARRSTILVCYRGSASTCERVVG
jgi:hypothetical protein